MGEVPAKLLTRHWIITDANGRVQEVRGDGVVAFVIAKTESQVGIDGDRL